MGFLRFLASIATFILTMLLALFAFTYTAINYPSVMRDLMTTAQQVRDYVRERSAAGQLHGLGGYLHATQPVRARRLQHRDTHPAQHRVRHPWFDFRAPASVRGGGFNSFEFPVQPLGLKG